MKYVRIKASGYYFEPSAKMVKGGFHPEPLGTDQIKAAARAKALTDEWEVIRTSGDPNAKAPPKPGTVDELIAILKGTKDKPNPEWTVKSQGRQENLDYSFGLIGEAGFGPIRVSKITPADCLEFYAGLADYGRHAQHDVYRDLRYLINYAIRLQYDGLKGRADNPTYIVKNKAPAARTQKWTTEQVEAGIRKGWNDGYKGAAVALAILYDTSMRGVDARKLPPEELDLKARKVMIHAQSKTGTPHWAPLWPFTVKIIKDYLVELGAVPMTGQPILRTRTGLRYTRIQLSRDLRTVMTLAGIGRDVQARDLRRTAQLERAIAGATAPELGAGAGQSVTSSQQIIDTYVPANFELAKSAQDKRGRKLRTKQARRA